jgi:putative colanic acid biosynthesis UDP-glucose lipid carrier transferase
MISGSLALTCTLHLHTHWSSAYTMAALLAVLAFNMFGEMNALYRTWRGSSRREELLTAAWCWLLVIPVLLFAAFATKMSDEFSRVVVVLWFVTAPAALVMLRLAVRFALRRVRRNGANLRTAGIVGVTPMGLRLMRHINEDPALGIRFAGFYDDRDAEREDQVDAKGQKLGDLKQLQQDARVGKLDVVYVALPLRAELRIGEVVRKLSDTTASVYMAADVVMFDVMHGRWGTVADIPVVSIYDSPFDGASGLVKRLEDIVLSSVILLLVALPMTIIALAIKFTSPGPVLFVQRRYGLGGKPISVVKFRTMTCTEDGPHVVQAMKDDPRVTRLGAFLRRHSLDELPQFLNVLSGSMSVVGPRPHAIAHNELYRSQIHGYMLRHKVKPGITGWAQVNGWRGETDTVEKMQRRIEHDLYYINNWSLFWDVKIVLLTVFGASSKDNAY